MLEQMELEYVQVNDNGSRKQSRVNLKTIR